MWPSPWRPAGLHLPGTHARAACILLALMSLLFLIGALGFGLFISAAIKSQVLATQVAMIATYLPALLLSGFLFEICQHARLRCRR